MEDGRCRDQAAKDDEGEEGGPPRVDLPIHHLVQNPLATRFLVVPPEVEEQVDYRIVLREPEGSTFVIRSDQELVQDLRRRDIAPTRGEWEVGKAPTGEQ